MTYEQSATSGEICPWDLQKQGTQGACVSLYQSPSVTEPLHMPVARQAQMAALLGGQQMRPHAKSQSQNRMPSSIECNVSVASKLSASEPFQPYDTALKAMFLQQ